MAKSRRLPSSKVQSTACCTRCMKLSPGALASIRMPEGLMVINPIKSYVDGTMDVEFSLLAEASLLNGTRDVLNNMNTLANKRIRSLVK